MKATKGFKQTEIGEIPEDWEIAKIGDLLDFKNGLNKGSEFFGYGTPIINYMDVFRFNGIKLSDVEGKVFLNSQEKNNFSAKKGDVFFTRTSEIPEEIGMASVLLEEIPDCVFSGFILRGRPKNNKISTDFFRYCLIPSYVRRQIISTSSYTTRALTNGRYLSNVKLQFPPSLSEQQAIAEVLSDMDRMISQTEALIEKKKAIKQGMMQELLKPKDGWVEMKLRDIGLIITGSTPSTLIKEYWNGNVPWITPTDIGNKKNIYNSEREVSGSGFQKCRKLPKGTLLVTCIASIGKNAVLKVDGACNQQINAIIPNKEHDVDFLYYLMENNKSYLQTKAGITATLIISKKEFEDISFFFPPTHIEQSDIANILSEIEINIDIHVTKLQKLKLQKQGMMQALLTGRIRLT
jgi:type I restriction enzyme S subunit